MKKGFYTIMAAQFFSSLADNALLVAAIELLRQSDAPAWHIPALTPMFALFYVLLAPLVGAFADAVPKGTVMFISNAIKVAGCLIMLFGAHPLLARTASSASAPLPIHPPSTASSPSCCRTRSSSRPTAGSKASPSCRSSSGSCSADSCSGL